MFSGMLWPDSFNWLLFCVVSNTYTGMGPKVPGTSLRRIMTSSCPGQRRIHSNTAMLPSRLELNLSMCLVLALICSTLTLEPIMVLVFDSMRLSADFSVHTRTLALGFTSELHVKFVNGQTVQLLEVKLCVTARELMVASLGVRTALAAIETGTPLTPFHSTEDRRPVTAGTTHSVAGVLPRRYNIIQVVISNKFPLDEWGTAFRLDDATPGVRLHTEEYSPLADATQWRALDAIAANALGEVALLSHWQQFSCEFPARCNRPAAMYLFLLELIWGTLFSFLKTLATSLGLKPRTTALCCDPTLTPRFYTSRIQAISELSTPVEIPRAPLTRTIRRLWWRTRASR